VRIPPPAPESFLPEIPKRGSLRELVETSPELGQLINSPDFSEYFRTCDFKVTLKTVLSVNQIMSSKRDD
jgi:hypothetical protein